MERIVVHEGPHRPILRDHFAGEVNDTAQLHASGFDVDRRVYRFHASDSVSGAMSSGQSASGTEEADRCQAQRQQDQHDDR